ncbi:hypothetical protein K437DRAFT_278499 [Tilletiaria anomala UBC 951]|uniref:Amino acid transporter n=1 Tax=Tilletiaria anomala (strain ATCC 24038 / CBS 436.72 / UBC 951) TaxID=1037660 RepID=A0A066VY95_TILAU|nr:uncharacterized protein K437DRAFT_278499 [Tilletiaria anomala UBC 951]KDN45258.1 hypothetical protein K437DRAFT_278499 [Tilletiaria anomala UBC 951]
MSSALQSGLLFGGPLSLFWGWTICAFFVYPTSGGVYFWISRLAPSTPALGFFTGNLYAWAMVLTGCSGNLSVALYLSSMVEIGTGVHLTPVQVAAIAWGICILSGIVNIWWTLGGTILLVVTLFVKSAPAGHNSAKFVFTDFENVSGYSNTGFVVLLGFLQAVYTLEGCETGAQVAEEAKNAAWAAPVSISVSIAGSWLLGVIYLLALLFSVRSIESIANTSYAIPISQLYVDIMGQRLSLLCLFVIMFAQWAAALTAWTASSRLFYALARDGAFKPRRWFMYLAPTHAPIAGYIGSPIAFSAIISSAAISVMIAYLMPLVLRVLRPNCMPERGPFHLGRFSYTCSCLGSAFGIFVCVLFILPTYKNVTAQNMNYAIVAVGAVALLVGVQYLIFRFCGWTFKGVTRTLEEEQGLQRADAKNV